MGKKVLLTIINEIRSAKYFSTSVDSALLYTYRSATVIIRYVVNSKPVEQFITFIPMFSHTGAEIAEMILTFLKDNHINVENCRGQSYDNASNMSGKYK